MTIVGGMTKAKVAGRRNHAGGRMIEMMVVVSTIDGATTAETRSAAGTTTIVGTLSGAVMTRIAEGSTTSGGKKRCAAETRKRSDPSLAALPRRGTLNLRRSRVPSQRTRRPRLKPHRRQLLLKLRKRSLMRRKRRRRLLRKRRRRWRINRKP